MAIYLRVEFLFHFTTSYPPLFLPFLFILPITTLTGIFWSQFHSIPLPWFAVSAYTHECIEGGGPGDCRRVARRLGSSRRAAGRRFPVTGFQVSDGFYHPQFNFLCRSITRRYSTVLFHFSLHFSMLQFFQFPAVCNVIFEIFFSLWLSINQSWWVVSTIYRPFPRVSTQFPRVHMGFPLVSAIYPRYPRASTHFPSVLRGLPLISTKYCRCPLAYTHLEGYIGSCRSFPRFTAGIHVLPRTCKPT